jgi:hypothetical protein
MLYVQNQNFKFKAYRNNARDHKLLEVDHDVTSSGLNSKARANSLAGTK